MVNELQKVRQAICEVGRRLYDHQYVVAHDGNITVRWSQGEFLCTPTRICKGRMSPADICLIDAAGNVIGGSRQRSSEAPLHLRIYAARPDVQAIVHCHSPHALAFAATHRPLPRHILPEVEVLLGEVPLVPYATPGTEELAASVLPYLERCKVLLLANHGSVGLGGDLEQALWHTEILEHYCRVVLLAERLGPLQPLSEAQLQGLRRRYVLIELCGRSAHVIISVRPTSRRGAGSGEGRCRSAARTGSGRLTLSARGF